MRVLRWIIITGAVVVLLAGIGIAIGAAWLNTYIHSDAFKAEVEKRAAQTVGGTVKIGQVDFDIFNGVKLQGLDGQIDPSHAGGQGALQVQVASVNCSYAWKELLNRRLKLTGVILDKPQIVLTKQPTAPLAPTAVAPANSETASGPVTGSTSQPSSSLPFQFILDRARLNDGAVSIRDADGTSMVEMHGVYVDADTSGYTVGKDVTGTLKIADAVASNLHVTNFFTPISYNQSQGALLAKPFAASAFGGSIAGDYQAQGSGPSILDVNAKGLDVGQITTATSSGSSARLTGALDLQSKWRAVETGDINGEGDAQMANGRLEGVKILQDIGSILRINELTAPIIITKAQTHFLVQNRQTQFTGLQLNSPILQITGGGTIGFDGALNADLVLILSSDTMKKLPSEIVSSFVQSPDGSGSIGFKVSGTTANPQTDLPTRLLMQNTQIKNVINKALNKFFH